MKTILCTICGRAGSKGVKSKNFRNFLGEPLIYYTLRAFALFKEAYASLYSVDCVVSSDSEDILSYAGQFKDILIRHRPSDLAQDDSPKVPVIQDATKYAEKYFKKDYDYIVDLDITSPLRHSADIDRAIKKCAEDNGTKYDVIFSATESRRNPYFNMVEMKGDYAFKIRESEFVARQQAPKTYDMNPSIYCYNRNSLLSRLKQITFEGRQGVLEMEDTYVIDIDREMDFEILELLVREHYAKSYPELFCELSEKDV